MTGDDRLVGVAERAARAGAAVAADSFREDVAVRTKGVPGDLVTAADHAAQDRVVAVLEDAVPGHAVVGEETGLPDAVPDEGPAWVIDPIDGTNNFVRGLPLWATSVAAVEAGEPVAAATVLPVLDQAFVSGPDGAALNGDPIETNDRADLAAGTVAATSTMSPSDRDRLGDLLAALAGTCYDLRRLGSAQVTLALVAAGTLDAAVALGRPSPWDSIAGAHLVRRAGGEVTDAAGKRWHHGAAGLVASNGPVHGAVLDAIPS